MAWIGLIASGMQAASQIQQGQVDAANARLQAAQDDRDANSALAESQANASQERRRAKFLRSRAMAVAGKSGAGGAQDPTVANILNDLDTEGEMRALNALYEGENLAEGLRSGAQAKRRMGKASQAAGTMAGVGSLAEGGYSFYSRYG
jgi:hypothetical protein